MNDYINKLFSLNKKVAIVIGGGGHLCSDISLSLLYSGCYVYVLDIRSNKFLDLKNRVKNKNFLKNLFCYKFNAQRKSDYLKIIKKIKKDFQTIDILVNGSGINSPEAFIDIDLRDWQKVIKSHLDSTFLSCQIFGKLMVKNKKGSIINISSASSNPPLSKAFAYSVAKSGITNLTKNLAREWATSNVRVNSLRPGFFPTKWNLKNFIDNNRRKKIISHTPMKRFGHPNELASTLFGFHQITLLLLLALKYLWMVVSHA